MQIFICQLYLSKFQGKKIARTCNIFEQVKDVCYVVMHVKPKRISSYSLGPKDRSLYLTFIPAMYKCIPANGWGNWGSEVKSCVQGHRWISDAPEALPLALANLGVGATFTTPWGLWFALFFSPGDLFWHDTEVSSILPTLSRPLVHPHTKSSHRKTLIWASVFFCSAFH